MNAEQEKIAEVIKLISGLSFGEVVVTVHDSEIVQIEKKERKRFKARKRLHGQS